MNDRNTILLADKLAGLYKLSGIFADLVIDPVAGFFNCRCSTVHQRDTHSNSTDIKMLAVEHLHRFYNFMFVYHKLPLISDSVHCIEKAGVLNSDLHA